ncbi:hypothetical protein SNE40_015124 [Patella caerulea]|uniref:Uncharacterized protein n=1 Tax=Patella caerulea TaxID=87958 RepID=A0AAN8JIT8_PATCE
MNSLVVLAVGLVVATVTVINAETTPTTEVPPIVEETAVDPAILEQVQRNNERLTGRLQERLARLLPIRARFLPISARFLSNVNRKIAVTKAALANLDELVNNLITLPNQRPLRLSTVLGLAADLNASNPEATGVRRRRRGVETVVSPEDATEDEDDSIDELEEEMMDIMSEVELKADE